MRGMKGLNFSFNSGRDFKHIFDGISPSKTQREKINFGLNSSGLGKSKKLHLFAQLVKVRY